jgi:hypothetical protein
VVFGVLIFKLSVWYGAEGCVSGLRAAARKPDTTSQVACRCMEVTGTSEKNKQISQSLFFYQMMNKRVALKNIKMYIKTAPTCFGSITIIRERII